MVPDVFLISPVRDINPETLAKITEYVATLEYHGKKVYWPYRDTDQNDPVGIRICYDNFSNIIEAHEIHIWYDQKSQGSIFDCGGVFMLLVLRRHKKLVIANKDEVEQHAVPGKKSFENVLLALNCGEHVSVNTREKPT